jgi:hypothetical protein
VNESGRVRWLPEGTGPRAAAPHICARKWRPPCLLYCVGQTQTEEEGREGGGGIKAKARRLRRSGEEGRAPGASDRDDGFCRPGCGWQAATVERRWRASPAEDGGRRARRVEH